MRTKSTGERQKKKVLFDVLFSFPCAVTMTIKRQLAQAFTFTICVRVCVYLSLSVVHCLFRRPFFVCFFSSLLMLLCLACVQNVCFGLIGALNFEAHLRKKKSYLFYPIKFSCTLKGFVYYDSQNKSIGMHFHHMVKRCHEDKIHVWFIQKTALTHKTVMSVTVKTLTPKEKR